MWKYEKRLQYPVKITKPKSNSSHRPSSASSAVLTENSAASMRYLSQQYTMLLPEKLPEYSNGYRHGRTGPSRDDRRTIVYQLTRRHSHRRRSKCPRALRNYYVDHTVGSVAAWPPAAFPFNSLRIPVTRAIAITDLIERHGCGAESPLHLR